MALTQSLRFKIPAMAFRLRCKGICFKNTFGSRRNKPSTFRVPGLAYIWLSASLNGIKDKCFFRVFKGKAVYSDSVSRSSPQKQDAVSQPIAISFPTFLIIWPGSNGTLAEPGLELSVSKYC